MEHSVDFKLSKQLEHTPSNKKRRLYGSRVHSLIFIRIGAFYSWWYSVVLRDLIVYRKSHKSNGMIGIVYYYYTAIVLYGILL